MEKTQYFGILKQLHDICRDLPLPKLVGMEAYNEIMNYLWLRHSSDNSDDDLLRKLYDNYCTDKHILEDQHNIEINKNASKSGIKKDIFSEKLSEIFLPGLIDQKRNNKIAFVKIMGNNIDNCKLDIGRLTVILHQDEGSTGTDGGMKAQKLINKIYKKDFLPTKNGKFNIILFPYDAVGEGFEKFMSDAGSTGGNWGQFFTNPQVGNWIVKKAYIKKTDIIGDIFAGSGGLILNAKKTSKITSKNIYAHESDDKIFKFLRFNSQIAELEMNNIEKGDTYDYTGYLKNKENFFDKLILNPPYGESIDISLSTEDKTKFWGIMKQGKKTIKDSMGLAIYVMYKLLKNKGIASFVSERGFLNNGTENNSWQKKLRKFIIENTSITEILLLPKGIFAHTNFDTCCICFEKGKKTEKIIFSQGYFKDEDKGKGDKKMYINENILTITLEDIVNKDWSLKYDDYVEKIDDSYNGIEYKSLGEVCEFVSGKYNTQDFDKLSKETKYDFYCGQYNSPIGKISEYSFESQEPYIIFTKGGGCHTSLFSATQGYCNSYYIDKGKTSFCSVNIAFTRIKINSKYLYYILKCMKNKFRSNTKFSANLGSLNKSFLEKFKIPILPPDHQQRIVDYMDKTFGTDYKKLDKVVSKLKDYDLFKILLNENYDDFDELLITYDDILNAEGMLKRMETRYKNKLIERCFDSVKGKEMKLGELVNIRKGTFNTKNISGIGDIPYYNSGGKNPVSKHTSFSIDEPEYIIFVKDGGDKNNKCNINSGMAKSYYVNGKSAIISHNLIFTTNKINCKYLYNFLESFRKKNMLLAQYNSGLGHITQKKIIEIKIIVPSSEDQEKVVAMIQAINDEESEFNNCIKSLKTTITNLYYCVEQYTKGEAVVNNMDGDNGDEENDEEENDEEENDDEENDDEENDEEEEEEEEEELEHVEIKGKIYLSDGFNIYKINKDDTKGCLYGSIVDGKFKKCQS